MYRKFESLNKWEKRVIALISDFSVTIFSWVAAQWLSTASIDQTLNYFSIFNITVIQSSVYLMCGLYRGVWRFASIPDLLRIFRSVLLGTLLCRTFLKFNGYPISINVYIIYFLILINLLSSTRLLFRMLSDYANSSQAKRVLIVGGGSAGEGIIRDLCRSSSVYNYIAAAIVDDNTSRHGCEVQGIRIVGACKDICKVVLKYNIDLILISIPSADSKKMREIVQHCEKSKVPFRTLPSIQDIADGKVAVNNLREVLLEDLLGREQVRLDWQMLQSAIQNQTILVTGGGGSIGSELCKQICELQPKKLIIIENNEYNLYTIDLELSKKNYSTILHPYLCSVTDKLELQKIFKLYKPNMVFHVAAYKHVPLLESHIRVAMYNNIIGTKVVAELSENNDVETFVLISTDKAVNPTNIMGATKRASEVFCQTYNVSAKTKFITVRFGNVLNSTGSVVPLFRQQLLSGGPLTVTHRDINRYFMTIPEASQLILQAAAMDNQNDIFVLDMGEPISINYLAEQMIKLSGKEVGIDIEIEYTGLRPGEKLHEELLYGNETLCDTSHPKIKQAKGHPYDWIKLTSIINDIEIAYNSCDETKMKKLLLELVPEYREPEVVVKDPLPHINIITRPAFSYG